MDKEGSAQSPAGRKRSKGPGPPCGACFPPGRQAVAPHTCPFPWAAGSPKPPPPTPCRSSAPGTDLRDSVLSGSSPVRHADVPLPQGRGSAERGHSPSFSHPGTNQARPAQRPRSGEIGRVQGDLEGHLQSQILSPCTGLRGSTGRTPKRASFRFGAFGAGYFNETQGSQRTSDPQLPKNPAARGPAAEASSRPRRLAGLRAMDREAPRGPRLTTGRRLVPPPGAALRPLPPECRAVCGPPALAGLRPGILAEPARTPCAPASRSFDGWPRGSSARREGRCRPLPAEPGLQSPLTTRPECLSAPSPRGLWPSGGRSRHLT